MLFFQTKIINTNVYIYNLLFLSIWELFLYQTDKVIRHTIKTTSNTNFGLATKSGNNNNDSTQDKNVTIGSGEFRRSECTNGDGFNNNIANDNFANFDAFSSTIDLDLYGNIGFSSTQTGHNLSTKSTVSSTSTDAKDRFLVSLSQNDNFKNINDSFDTKFASFMTNDSTSKKKADTKLEQKSQQQFNLDGEDNFADFSNANPHFEATSQTSLPKSKSTTDCDKTKPGAEKITSKFFDDYSKNDEFDADLLEALKRSLNDQ